MRITTCADALKLDDRATVEGLHGTLEKVFKRRTGQTSGRDWSFQDGIVRDATGEITVTFNNHPDVSPWKGREVYLLSSVGAKGTYKGIFRKTDSYTDKDGVRKYTEKVQVNEHAVISEQDTAPAKDAEEAKLPPASSGAKKYWVQLPGGGPADCVLATIAQVQDMVNAGDEILIAEEGGDEWNDPEVYGFSRARKAENCPPAPVQRINKGESGVVPQKAPVEATGHVGGDPDGPRESRHGLEPPVGSAVTTVKFRRTEQLREYEPVSIEIEASVGAGCPLKPVYDYLSDVTKAMLNSERHKTK